MQDNLRANPNSPYYPYNKVYEGFFNLSSTLDIPRKVMDYILDMPDGYYTPKDYNNLPRCMLWKLLYYDEEHPENQALPTPQQKKSVLFDPDMPTKPPTDKGYRLFPQIYVKQAQTEAQTRIYCYMGRTIATDDFSVQLSVVFDIWTNYRQEANTKAADLYSRVYAIEQSILAAFHGVHMDGVGSFYFNRAKHGDCGSTPMTDRDGNIGRSLVMGLEVKSETPNGNIENNYVPIGNGIYFG